MPSLSPLRTYVRTVPYVHIVYVRLGKSKMFTFAGCFFRYVYKKKYVRNTKTQVNLTQNIYSLITCVKIFFKAHAIPKQNVAEAVLMTTV